MPMFGSLACSTLFTEADEVENALPIACFRHEFDRLICIGLLGAGHEAIFLGEYRIQYGSAFVRPAWQINGFILHTRDYEQLLQGTLALGARLATEKAQPVEEMIAPRHLPITRIRTGKGYEARIELRGRKSRVILLGTFVPLPSGQYWGLNRGVVFDCALYSDLLGAVVQLGDFLGRAGPVFGELPHTLLLPQLWW